MGVGARRVLFSDASTVLYCCVQNVYTEAMARPREFDEPTVLAAAERVFWSTGYRGTSIDDLTKLTGLGKGSLYGAYGDKHQLFQRVFDRYCARVVEQTQEALAGPDEGALTRLGSYVTEVAEDTASDSQGRGCLLANGVAELAEHDPAVRDRARRAFTALEQALSSAIRAAQRHGDIDGEVDAADLAGLLLAVLRGIEALGKGGADPDQLRQIARTALRATVSTTIQC